MKSVASLGLVLGVALAVSACESTEEKMAEKGAMPMSASEIEALVVDKTAYGTSDNGSKFILFYDPSGEVRGSASGSWGKSSDTGTWKITADDMLCLQFKQWRDGANRCWRLYDDGGTINWVGKVGPAKSRTGDDVWKQGNPENL